MSTAARAPKARAKGSDVSNQQKPVKVTLHETIRNDDF